MKKIIIFICLAMCSFSQAETFFGSIAINAQTGITGTSNNAKTSTSAVKNALAICNKKNKMKNSCKSLGYVSDGCAAVVWSKSTKLLNAAMSEDDMNVAIKRALNKCNVRAPDCKVAQALCTNWETVESTLIWW